MGSQFLKNYISEATRILKLTNKDVSEKDIRKYVKSQIIKNLSMPEVKLHNNYTDPDLRVKVIVDEHGREAPNDLDKLESQSVLEVIDNYLNGEFITTGFGVCFKSHETAINMKAKMIKSLLDKRSLTKKQMFTYLENNDTSNANKYDLLQKTYKLLNNSYYGATGEVHSQFYNSYISPSITYSGVQLITTAIAGFESFLGSNIYFEDMNELINYIYNIIDQNYSIKDYVPNLVPKSKIYNYVKENIVRWDITPEEERFLFQLFKGMSLDDANKIYFKNNLYSFLNSYYNTGLIGDIIKSGITIKSIDNITDQSIIDNLNTLWNALDTCVAYYEQSFDRYNRVYNMHRKSVLIIDTDSNFLTLNSWIEYVKNEFNVEISNEDQKFTVVNVCIYFLSKFIEKLMQRMLQLSNVKEEHWKNIRMKNEFFYERVMNTSNKKQYVGLLRLREGVVIEPRKVDMKGMSIVKSTVNKKSREFFSNTVKHEILEPENINVANVIREFDNFEKYISDSLKNGETTFLIPAKVNSPSSYKLPQSTMPVRAMYCWNELFPNQEIVTPAKISILKLKCKSIGDLKSIYGTEWYDIIIKKIFNNSISTRNSSGDRVEVKTISSDNGWDVIAIPKSVTVIPDILREFIDYDAMIQTNIQNGSVIMKSLGVKVIPKSNNKTYYTTIIDV